MRMKILPRCGPGCPSRGGPPGCCGSWAGLLGTAGLGGTLEDESARAGDVLEGVSAGLVDGVAAASAGLAGVLTADGAGAAPGDAGGVVKAGLSAAPLVPAALPGLPGVLGSPGEVGVV